MQFILILILVLAVYILLPIMAAMVSRQYTGAADDNKLSSLPTLFLTPQWICNLSWKKRHRPLIDARMKRQMHGYFAAPTRKTIKELAMFFSKNTSGVISLGAGNGAFEQHLSKATAVPIYAVDARPKSAVYSVDIVDFMNLAEMAKYTEEKTFNTVLVSWPPYQLDITPILRQLAPKYIIYVGEDREGCTGSDELFDLFDKAIASYSMPYCDWGGMHDKCTVYEFAE